MYSSLTCEPPSETDFPIKAGCSVKEKGWHFSLPQVIYHLQEIIWKACQSSTAFSFSAS